MLKWWMGIAYWSCRPSRSATSSFGARNQGECSRASTGLRALARPCRSLAIKAELDFNGFLWIAIEARDLWSNVSIRLFLASQQRFPIASCA
jgi:hypothetical protein